MPPSHAIQRRRFFRLEFVEMVSKWLDDWGNTAHLIPPQIRRREYSEANVGWYSRTLIRATRTTRPVKKVLPGTRKSAFRSVALLWETCRQKKEEAWAGGGNATMRQSSGVPSSPTTARYREVAVMMRYRQPVPLKPGMVSVIRSLLSGIRLPVLKFPPGCG